MKRTYPLHEAAREANLAIVETLLREGANPFQKNSSGKTAVEVAEKVNQKSSHAAVLLALSDATSAVRAGGC